MSVSSKKLIGLKVETKSGEMLGHVREIELSSDNLQVEKIFVKPSSIVKGLVSGDLIINKNAIISIEEEVIIVEDLSQGELATQTLPEGSPAV